MAQKGCAFIQGNVQESYNKLKVPGHAASESPTAELIKWCLRQKQFVKKLFENLKRLEPGEIQRAIVGLEKSQITKKSSRRTTLKSSVRKQSREPRVHIMVCGPANSCEKL